MKGSGSESAASQRKRGGTVVGEVVRVQMRVSERTDSRVRRALLRIAAGQVRAGLLTITVFFPSFLSVESIVRRDVNSSEFVRPTEAC